MSIDTDTLRQWAEALEGAEDLGAPRMIAGHIRLELAARARAAVPRCACCGTTENLHADVGSGGPWRCSSADCMVW